MKRLLFVAPCIAFLIFLGWVVGQANSGQINRYFGFINDIPYGDKVGHLLLMGTFCFLANLAFRFRFWEITGRWRLLRGTVVATIVVLVEECSQIFLENRSFDVKDLAADLIGIAIADALARFCAQKSG